MAPILPKYEPYISPRIDANDKETSYDQIEEKIQSVIQSIFLEDENSSKLGNEWNRLPSYGRAIISTNISKAIHTNQYHFNFNPNSLSKFSNKTDNSSQDDAIYAALIVNMFHFMLVDNRKLHGDELLSRFNVEVNSSRGQLARVLIILEGISNQNFNYSEDFKKYGITDEKTLFEIYRYAIETHQDEEICTSIPYGLTIIKSENLREELARLIAKMLFSHISSYIHLFEIKNPLLLVEIAKEAINSNSGEDVAENITNYGFTNKETLIEIAKAAASKSGSRISKHIKNFEIKDETTLVEIAKLEAKCCFIGPSQYIENYGIKDPQVMIEIAKIAATCSTKETSKYIQNYKIQNQQALTEIAKIVAHETSGAISEFIDNYNTKDEKDRIEIAMIAAKANPDKLSRFIQKYKIEDVQARIQIAKAVARINGHVISEHIQNFNISDSDTLFEIAKLAITENPIIGTTGLHNFNIHDKNKLDYLYKLILFHIPGLYYPNYSIIETATQIENFHKMLLNHVGTRITSEKLVSQNITSKLPPGDDQIYIPERIINDILKKNFLTSEYILDITKFILQLLFIRENIGERRFQKLEKCIEGIYSLHHPELRKLIFPYLLDCTENQASAFETLCNNYGKATYQTIPYLLLTILNQQGVGEDLNTSRSKESDVVNPINTMAKSLKGFKSKGNLVYKDAIAHQRLLSFLQYLILEENLNYENKGRILKYLGTISTKEEAVLALKMLIGIKDLVSNLNCFSVGNIDLDKIKTEFKNAFERTLGTFDISNFDEKFENVFGNFRTPHALYSYIGKMQKLSTNDKKQMLSSIRTFILEVIEDTYHRNRYLGSSHLDEIFKKMPYLENKWKKNFSHELKINNAKESLSDFNIKNSISDSLRQNHDHGQLNTVRDFLNNEQISLQTDDPFCKELINLCRGSSSNVGELLQKCIDTAPSYIKQTQFMQDLRDWKNILESNRHKNSSQDLIIVNTDDPWDVFLCGTEVLGSCQSVEGVPDYNKCLMGYVLDGKNRLIAIKDQTGKIQSRAIFRLLMTKQGEPALFLERLYPQTIPKSHRETLIAFAIENAKSLDLPLYSLEVEGGVDCDVRLTSKSSRAPYEYVDAGNGLKIKGIWDCKASELLYAPPSGG